MRFYYGSVWVRGSGGLGLRLQAGGSLAEGFWSRNDSDGVSALSQAGEETDAPLPWPPPPAPSTAAVATTAAVASRALFLVLPLLMQLLLLLLLLLLLICSTTSAPETTCHVLWLQI